MVWNLQFRAMGTRVHLLVEGEPELLPAACREIERLDRLWSRFIEESDVCRLNRAAGAAVPVAPETVELLARAAEAYEMTAGLFDPTLLNEVVAAGYDRDFDAVREDGGGPAPATPPARPDGGYPVALDAEAASATITPPAGFDSGGIGKGLAADMVAESLVGAGATRAMVNLGGDLRAVAEPGGKPWTIAIDNPFDRSGPPALDLRLGDGGLATSTSLIRRWQQGGIERHHLIDPRSGRPASGEIASVTVIAGRGWRAEALAKAAFLSPPAGALELLAASDATGLLVEHGGRVRLAPGIEPYLLTPPQQIASVSLRERSLAGTRIRIPRPGT